MGFLKVLGKKNNYKNKISILYKINKGYLEKKNYLKINLILLSNDKINLILFLKKLNLINFHININKYIILLKKKKNLNLNNNYLKIFLRYFENKPIYIF